MEHDNHLYTKPTPPIHINMKLLTAPGPQTKPDTNYLKSLKKFYTQR